MGVSATPKYACVLGMICWTLLMTGRADAQPCPGFPPNTPLPLPLGALTLYGAAGVSTDKAGHLGLASDISISYKSNIERISLFFLGSETRNQVEISTFIQGYRLSQNTYPMGSFSYIPVQTSSTDKITIHAVSGGNDTSLVQACLY